MPAFLAVSEIQRNKITIGCFEIEPFAIDAHTAVSDVNAAFRLTRVMPDLTAGASVNGPHMIRQSQVHHALDHDGCGFDGPSEHATATRVRAKYPVQAE